VLLLTRQKDQLQTTVGVRDLENANQRQQISVLQSNLATAPMFMEVKNELMIPLFQGAKLVGTLNLRLDFSED
jgi:hypothetical protein